MDSLQGYITDFKNSPIKFKPVYSYKKLKDGSTKIYSYENKNLSTTTKRTTFMKNVILFNYDRVVKQSDKKTAEDITALYHHFHPEDKDYVYAPKKINVFKLHDAHTYLQQMSNKGEQKESPTPELKNTPLLSLETTSQVKNLTTQDNVVPSRKIRQFVAAVDLDCTDSLYGIYYIIAHRTQFDFSLIEAYYALSFMSVRKDKSSETESSKHMLLSKDLWLSTFMKQNMLTLFQRLIAYHSLIAKFDSMRQTEDERKQQSIQVQLIRKRNTDILTSLLDQITHVTSIINLISPYNISEIDRKYSNNPTVNMFINMNSKPFDTNTSEESEEDSLDASDPDYWEKYQERNCIDDDYWKPYEFTEEEVTKAIILTIVELNKL